MKNSVLTSLVCASTVALSLPLASSPAQAAFIKGTCNVSDVTAGGVIASQCLNFDGNDSNYKVGSGPQGFENYINDAFGTTGIWSLLGKSDKPGDAVTDIGEGLQNGNWSLVAPNTVSSPFVVTLKASDFFAAYLFKGLTDISSGTFSVAGITLNPENDQRADLSHLSVYSTDSSTAIPTPALLPGLIGMGVAALRKRRSEGSADANS